MGRKFATFYRFILMTTSVSAVVLSIISATSCAFVSFDHQYKASSTSSSSSSSGGGGGRRMLLLNEWKELSVWVMGGWNLNHLRGGRRSSSSSRVLQEEEDNALPDTPPESFSTLVPIPSGQNGHFTSPGTRLTESPTSGGGERQPAVDLNLTPGIQLTEPTEPNDTTAGEQSGMLINGDPGGVAGDAMAETVAAPADTTSSGTTPGNGPNSVGGDPMAGTVTAPSDTTGAAPSNGPNSVGGDTMAGTVTAPSDTAGTTPNNGPNGVGGDPMAGTVTTPSDEDTGDVDFGPGSNGDSMAGSYSGESSTPQISGGGGDSSTYGSSAYGSGSTASASGASAIVKGDAGLFCDTDPSFTYTSLWNGGSVKAFEAEIASESDNNKSEEVARNAVVAATIVGAFMATILTFEFLAGWKMCLEKWFIGFLALVACVSQGVTFAFFNSQRYCDGDLLHELLNQEPCVLGQGGVMSIMALLLYFFTMLLVCKVPEDEPYGLCCKGRKNNDAEKVFQGNDDGDSGSLMGGDPNNAKPERPNWISEENRGGDEDEEHEII